jgi:hypothetical protein
MGCTPAALKDIARMQSEIEWLRAVLKPLLDHYLSCYEGNKDALALEAERALGIVEQTTREGK